MESIILSPFENITDCGIKCILSVENCDFFYYEFPKCHLGSYNCTAGLDMPVPNEFKTYHNIDHWLSEMWENKFLKFGSKKAEVGDWNKWIFKKELSYNSIKRCTFLCSMDAECEFFVLDNFCYFGSFSYFGVPVNIENLSNEVTYVYLKVNRDFRIFITLKWQIIGDLMS